MLQKGCVITDPLQASAREHLAADPKLQASAKELLIAELNSLRLEVGMPSLGELVRLGKGKFSKSTLDDHLAGRRATVPNWRLTSAYIDACVEAAKETGLSIERLGTMEEWRVRWRSAQRGDRSAVSPIRDSSIAATHTLGNKPSKSQADVASLQLEHLTELESRLSSSESRAVDVTTAGITIVMRRLEEDLSRLGGALSSDMGLLVVISGPTIGARFSVERDLTTIGRDPESDIFLDEPTISRRHAVIHRYGTDFTIRDLGSRNNTFVHQRKIKEETSIISNDEIQVGVFRMLFIQGDSKQ